MWKPPFPVLALLTTCSLASACASLHEEEQTTAGIDREAEADFTALAATADTGLSAYPGGQTKVEWLSCRLAAPAKGSVLLFHGDHAGYDPRRFCQGWHAQAFLHAGYHVLALNRPGYGASPGQPDFAGPASLAAVKGVLPVATAAAKLPQPISGAWGYGGGATAAALASKQLPGLKFLILGGGIYDFEEALRGTTDAAAKADLGLIKSAGEKAIEERSVAFDPTGLPQRLELYHGTADQAAPFAQAKAFADALTSSGQYQVTFQTLDGQGHTMPWIYHRHVVEALLQSLVPPPPP